MTCGDKVVSAKIDIEEMTGSEKILYFILNNSKCSAKVSTDFSYNENIELRLDEKNMYFFDKESGMNLIYN